MTDFTNIPWDKIMNIECSPIYREIFDKLRRSNNEGIQGGTLFENVFSRRQSANQILKHAGIQFFIKPVGGTNTKGWWVENLHKLYPRS